MFEIMPDFFLRAWLMPLQDNSADHSAIIRCTVNAAKYIDHAAGYTTICVIELHGTDTMVANIGCKGLVKRT